MDDEPHEEKDHFVAQLYKFMDDRGTPLNRQPTIANKDIDLYRLFNVSCFYTISKYFFSKYLFNNMHILFTGSTKTRWLQQSDKSKSMEENFVEIGLCSSYF